MSIKTQGDEVEVFWNYEYDLASFIGGKRLSDTRATICVLTNISDGIDNDDTIISILLKAIKDHPDKYWKITR